MTTAATTTETAALKGKLSPAVGSKFNMHLNLEIINMCVGAVHTGFPTWNDSANVHSIPSSDGDEGERGRLL